MRPTSKIISKPNLRHNLAVLKNIAKKSKFIAVVKANAYSCEVNKIYDALDDADLFAVCGIDEAINLREAGSEKPILLLEGAFEKPELHIAKTDNFELVVATEQQLNWLLEFESCYERIWLKVNTGMNRLGFKEYQIDSVMSDLLKKYKQEQIVLMTHFSSSDDRNNVTSEQISVFNEIKNRYPLTKSCLCNSAGVFEYQDAHGDFVRSGLALYGVSPFADKTSIDLGLKPIMQLKTKVIAINDCTAGEPIGYSQTAVMQCDGRIAICAVGYADGYPRSAPTGTPVLINNKKFSLIGRVAMDMIAVLIDESINVGDEVECWGENLLAETICASCDTVGHELLARVSHRPNLVIID